MKSRKIVTCIAALLSPLCALDVTAGSLEPELEAAIVDLRPKDKIDVIIRCADPVRPRDIVDADHEKKRKKLIKALRAKTALCQKLIKKDLDSAAGENRKPLWLINSVAATVRVGGLDRLAQRRGVASIGLNAQVLFPTDPAPPPVVSGQPGNPGYTFWNLSEIRIPDLWAMGYYGQGVVVGTMDTGVDLEHADLGPNWRGGSNSWFDPSGVHAGPFDAEGHGTEVMGIILGGNSLGVDIGAAPGAEWIAAKIFDDAGVSDLARIHQAFQWMLDPDGDPETDDAPDILNNSWALPNTGACDGEFAADIEALRTAGTAVVFAAGNFGPGVGSSVEPANNPGSLSVGAVDYYRDVEYSSSRGPSACGGGVYPNLVAPGKDIFTTGLTGGGANPSAYAYASGTSMAAPHVVGAMAVLKAAVPEATAAELDGVIQSGAVDLGAAGADNDSGAGYLDAVEAYFLLADGVPVDTDGDGVSDDLDQCPGSPAAEPVDAAGCADSQIDTDNDGVSDALDLCPGTSPGEAIDANGCPLGPPDLDADGYAADVDCDDTDASVHPGAAELKGDGIDQDCNGFDLTIEVTRARYVSRQDKLVIWATSDFGSAAGLRVTVDLEGGGSIDRALAWSSSKGRWQRTLKPVASKFGAAPSAVSVYGDEGSMTKTVELR